jgi:hypothetical protein
MRDKPLKFWLGSHLSGWTRLMITNRFDISPRYLPDALLITLAAAGHSLARGAQALIFGHRIRQTRLHDAPVFVIGHWRSGTTHLHNLLSQDPQFTWPTSFQCFNPNDFLLTGRLLKRFVRTLPTRAMDSMTLSLDGPQEDEFALCNLGLPSPYLHIAFPNRPFSQPESLDLEGMDSQALTRWKETFLHFLKMISAQKPGCLLLKSPSHTCRIPTLLELFPGARFVHIVRSPYSVIPSTLHLWKVLYSGQALQIPDFVDLENDIFNTYAHVFRRLGETRSRLPVSQFCEVRFEDVLAQPIQNLRRIYQQLHLGDMEVMRPKLERYLADTAEYRPRRWELPPEMRNRIRGECDRVIREYRYAEEPLPVWEPGRHEN